MSRILVTGASGFIGSHLCDRLFSQGHEVHGVSRSIQTSGPARIQWSKADVCDREAVRSLIKRIRPQIIFHLAARVNGYRELSEVVPTFETNLASTIYLLVAAAEENCERVVLAGSCESPPVGEPQTPCSPYAAAKWSLAGYADMFRAVFRVSMVVPRIFVTYGPGLQDTRKIIPYTILSMLRGQRPRLTEGRRLVDWIYIDDVVEGLLKAAFSTLAGVRTFDLGSGSLVSIRAMASRIAGIIGNGVEPEFGALPERLLEHERVADTFFLEREFGWKPSTSLNEGLAKTVDWFKKLGTSVARAS